MLYIGFTSGAQTDSEGGRQAVGELTLGEDSERFVLPLGQMLAFVVDNE
jgi:hypothetical protein